MACHRKRPVLGFLELHRAAATTRSPPSARAARATSDSKQDNDNAASQRSSREQNAGHCARQNHASYLPPNRADYYRKASLPSNAAGKDNRLCIARRDIDPFRYRTANAPESNWTPERLIFAQTQVPFRKTSSNPFRRNSPKGIRSGYRCRE